MDTGGRGGRDGGRFAQLSAHQSLNARSGLSKSWIRPPNAMKITAIACSRRGERRGAASAALDTIAPQRLGLVAELVRPLQRLRHRLAAQVLGEAGRERHRQLDA